MNGIDVIRLGSAVEEAGRERTGPERAVASRGPERIAECDGDREAPPLYNRGCQTASVRFKGIDHFRVSYWGESVYLQDCIDSFVSDNFGVNLDDLGRPAWESGRGNRRSLGSSEWGLFPNEGGRPCIWIEHYDGFCHLVVSGHGCTILGHDGLSYILQSLEASGARYVVRRVDFAWDDFPLDPWQVFTLLRDGHYRSRARITPHFVGTPGAEGKQTVYTHAKPEKAGIERYIRWYDMRGPTRLEIVIKGEWATRAVVGLLGSDDWQGVAMSELREFIDILDPSTRGDAYKRAYHPEWLAFIGQASRSGPLGRSRQAAEAEGLRLIGRYEGAVQRASKLLYEAGEAFGHEWVIERLRHYGRDKASSMAIETLKSLRQVASANCMAGIPPWPDSVDIPF